CLADSGVGMSVEFGLVIIFCSSFLKAWLGDFVSGMGLAMAYSSCHDDHQLCLLHGEFIKEQ
ncbi:MIC10 protein, partial [Nyctibius bracteatus]|nr:MIC10 protein [Nyctibius bracteatus]